MIDEKNESERAKIFFKRKTPVHIIKLNGYFYNGLITEVSSTYFVIKDRKIKDDFFVLYKELKKPIEKYQEIA